MTDDPLRDLFGPGSNADPLADIFGASAAPPLSEMDPLKHPKPIGGLAAAVQGKSADEANAELEHDASIAKAAREGSAIAKTAKPDKSDRGVLDDLFGAASYAADASRGAAQGLVQGAGSALSGVEEGSESITRLIHALGSKVGAEKFVDIWLAPADWFHGTAGSAIKAVGQEVEDTGTAIGPGEEKQNQTGVIISNALGQITGQIAIAMAAGAGASSVAYLGQSFDQLHDAIAEKGKVGTVGGDAATVLAAPLMAMTEKLGIDKILERVPPAIKNRFMRGLVDVGIAGGIEAAQEVAEQFVQNFALKAGVDPNQSLTEGFGPSAIGGGGAGAIVRAFLGKWGRHAHTPAPAGMREAGALSPDITPEDEASPLPTDLIVAGKMTMGAAGGMADANQALSAAGMPGVGTRVDIRHNGKTQKGAVADAWTVDVAGQTSTGIKIKLDDGTMIEEPLETLRDMGVQIRPEAPAGLPETDLADPEVQKFVAEGMKVLDATAAPESAETAPTSATTSEAPQGSEAASGGLGKANLPQDVIGQMVRAGIPEHVARGAAAGIMAESGGDHAALNPDSGALGLGQWLGPRKKALTARYGANPSREQQIEFLIHELKGGDAGGASVLSAKNEGEALEAYIKKFMRPAAGAETEGDLKRGRLALGDRSGSGVQDDLFGGEPRTGTQIDASRAVDAADQNEATNKDELLDHAHSVLDSDAKGDTGYTDYFGKRLGTALGVDLTADEAADYARAVINRFGKRDEIAEQADQVAEPTEAQKEAGNYRKGHINLHGLDITIETPKGATRSGTSPGGKSWSVEMPDHYGYVKRTTGADGEHVDVYVGPKPDSERVFVIDQHDHKNGQFDEHKAMLGYDNVDDATAAYDAAFNDGNGPARRQNITEMSAAEFRGWLDQPQTAPAAEGATSAATIIPENIPPSTEPGWKISKPIRDELDAKDVNRDTNSVAERIDAINAATDEGPEISTADEPARHLMTSALDHMGEGGRRREAPVWDRARRIAGMAGAKAIGRIHVAESLSYEAEWLHRPTKQDQLKAKQNGRAQPAAEEHPGLVIKSPETGKETTVQPVGTVAPKPKQDVLKARQKAKKAAKEESAEDREDREKQERQSAELRAEREARKAELAKTNWASADADLTELVKGGDRSMALERFKVDITHDHELRAMLDAEGVAMTQAQTIYRLEERDGEWQLREDKSSDYRETFHVFGVGQGWTREQAIEAAVSGSKVVWHIGAPGKTRYSQPFDLRVTRDADGRFSYSSDYHYSNGGGSGPSQGWRFEDRFATLDEAKAAGAAAVYARWQSIGESPRAVSADKATWSKVKALLEKHLDPAPASDNQIATVTTTDNNRLGPRSGEAEGADSRGAPSAKRSDYGASNKVAARDKARPPNRKPVGVIAFVRRLGGIKDNEGHDLSKGRGLRRYPGLINNKTGRGIDAIGEALWEAGYIGTPDDRPTEAEVLELLDEADRRPVYTKHEQEAGDHQAREERLAAQEADAEHDIRAATGEAGIDLNADEIASALHYYLVEGITAQEAIERTIYQSAALDLADVAAATRSEYGYADVADQIFAGIEAEARGGAEEGGERPVDLAGAPAEGEAPASEPRTASAAEARIPDEGRDPRDAGQLDAFGEQPGDQRRALEQKTEGRLRSDKTQKAPGADGGLFDVQDTTGDAFDSQPLINPPDHNAPPRAGLEPLYDEEDTARQIGWLDPTTGAVEPMEPGAKPAAGTDSSQIRAQAQAGPRRTVEIGPKEVDEIRARLLQRMAELGINDRVTLEVARGLKMGAPGWRGQYEPFGKIIKVALENTADAEHTLNHEAIHALRDLGAITAAEWRVITEKAWAQDRLREWVATTPSYQGLSLADQKEEAAAEYFADEVDAIYGRADQGVPLGRVQGMLYRAAHRVGRFLNALRHAVSYLRTGERGALSAMDVVLKIDSGEVGGRRGNAAGKPMTVTFGKKIIKEQAAPPPAAGAPSPLGRSMDDDEAAPPRLLAPVRALLDSVGPEGTSQHVGEAIDRFRQVVQDRMLPVLRVQAKVERIIGRPLGDEENPYLGEELMSGRIGARLEALTDQHVEPLFEGMRKQGITADELETFLYARHAKERNARIAAINPEFAEGTGSGMTDEEADAIMAAVDESGKRDNLEALAEQVDRLLAFSLDTRVESGLLSEEEANVWRSTYEHYVPLRGHSTDPETAAGVDRVRRQSGISVKGKESRRAFGRKSRAADILPYAILQAEEAVVRAETNRVGQQFLELAKEAPDPDFWRVDKIRRVPVFNKASGTVSYRSESRIAAEDAPYTVSLKFDGIEHRVTLNRDNPAAVRVADAMRNLSAQQFGVIVRTFGSVNRFLSAINTSYSPEFVITNALRDLQTASINLNDAEVKGVVRGVLKDYPAALKAATTGAFGKNSGEWGRWYQEFKLEGGRTYFNNVDDIARLRKRVQQAAKVAGTRLGAKGLLLAARDVVENVNSGVENALRLATYKNARERGLSKTQAASMAKNVTVNFNRKGSAGPVINAMYLFFNASMQGNARILMAMKSRRVQAVLLSSVLMGFWLELLNRWWSGDDDDGEKFYDKIGEFEKSRNLIVMLPGEHGRYIKLPMPWGYNVFPNLGRMLANLYQGDRALPTIANWASSVLDAFNPVGGAQSLLNIVSPTIADPIVDLVRNRDFADRPIMPDEKQFGPKVPDAQRYWGSVPPYWKAVTDFLTEASGGDDVRPGAVDVSPETLDFLQQTVFGAAGNFVRNNLAIASKLMSDDPEAQIDKNDLPFVRRVVGDKPVWYDKAAFYTRLAEVEQAVDYGKKYIKSGDDDRLDKLFADQGDVLELEKAAKQARKQMRGIRKESRDVDQALAAGKIDDETARIARTMLDEKERDAITGFNALYLETVKQPLRP